MTKTKLIPYLLISAALLLVGACSKFCNSGYEGSRCNELIVTKFEGRWNAVDTPGNQTYVDTIAAGSAINEITFTSGFAGHHFSHPVTASVLGYALTIPYQQPDSSGYFVRGSGTVSNDNNQITLSYQLISGPDTSQTILQYSGNWTRIN